MPTGRMPQTPTPSNLARRSGRETAENLSNELTVFFVGQRMRTALPVCQLQEFRRATGKKPEYAISPQIRTSPRRTAAAVVASVLVTTRVSAASQPASPPPSQNHHRHCSSPESHPTD